MTGAVAIMMAEDEEGADAFRGVFRSLNEVLVEADHPPHNEPEQLESTDTFQAQLWGYSGLHYLRRVAAYLTLEGRLPDSEPVEGAADDPVLQRLYARYDDYLNHSGKGLRQMLRRAPVKPQFEHLMLHSDAEGVYIPCTLADVIFDRAQPQREGLGGMVGSSLSLLSECRHIGAALSLPDDLDPESDEVWENADALPAVGEPWQRFGITTFVLTRLIRACELSKRTGAAVVFT